MWRAPIQIKGAQATKFEVGCSDFVKVDMRFLALVSTGRRAGWDHEEGDPAKGWMLHGRRSDNAGASDRQWIEQEVGFEALDHVKSRQESTSLGHVTPR
jgi:hypothetical protein